MDKPLIVNNHDLVVALYGIEGSKVLYEDADPAQWEENRQAFAVIPTDLVDLVTAEVTLGNNKVVLGAGSMVVKVLDFAGANKVLRTNSRNKGVEWVTPETVENVVYWEDIAGA